MSDITALLTVLLPSITALAGFAFRQHKNALKEAAESAVEKERAETYRREATRALDAKNEELKQIGIEKQELKALLDRCLNEELPRLHAVLATKEDVITRLGESYESISPIIVKLAEEMGISTEGIKRP